MISLKRPPLLLFLPHELPWEHILGALAEFAGGSQM